MKSLSSRRRMLVAAIAILLFLFLLRPGASRLKSRIAGSISAAMGRPVEIGSVHLRFLPRPGFDLNNLVIYDDSAYGAEPMLRAAEVTASLRLMALFRGRIEIARLDLSEPSLNLVHGSNGRWNLEALVERASQTPLAPTGAPRSASEPSFPYIEASSGRINFKNGPEKTPYALTNADFALWQDSANTWGVRLKAQPFRSDINLSDTGVLRVNGTWRRAASLRDTALQFSLEWDRPQLGQLTKYFSGDDMGWRGTALLEVNLSGTPAKLQVTSDASIRDFRRYDIFNGEALKLGAHCDAQYSSVDRVLRELFCQAPVGNGSLTLHGSASFPGMHEYNLVTVAQNVPAGALAALGQHIKKSVPDDLAALGTFEADFSFRRDGISGDAYYSGRGKIGGLQLASAKRKIQIDAGDIALFLSPGLPERESRSVRKSSAASIGPRLEFEPSPESTKHSIARSLRGWIDRNGYSLSLAGDVEVERALAAAQLLGLPALAASAEGLALVNLQVSGKWPGQGFHPDSEFQQPQVTGTAKLHNVHAELRGVDGPIEISGADLNLTPTDIRVTKLSAAAAHTLWNGSLQLPRGCGTPGACVVKFNLSTNQASLTDLSRWLNPSPKDQPWYRALSSRSQPPRFLASVRALGTINIAHLQVREVVVGHVSANVELAPGELHISDVSGDVLGGRYRAQWSADFSSKPATYTSSGTFVGLSLAKAGDAMKDEWITGTASGSYKLTASGTTSADFWKSAEGTVKYEMVEGSLPHVALLGDTGLLRIDKLSGEARLQNGEFESTEAGLESPAGAFKLNGTASIHREIDLTLTPSPMANTASRPHGYTITGTLSEPQVLQISGPETQAQLKSTPAN